MLIAITGIQDRKMYDLRIRKKTPTPPTNAWSEQYPRTCFQAEHFRQMPMSTISAIAACASREQRYTAWIRVEKPELRELQLPTTHQLLCGHG